MSKYAAIDVGSNAIRILIGTLDANGQVKCLKKKRYPIRLGADVFTTGSISRLAWEQSINAFKDFRDMMDAHDIADFAAVATSATREASNQNWFIDTIFDVTGIPVRVIDGTEEAEIIHQAVNSHIDLSQRHAMIIDIGGGSVEFTFVNCGQVEYQTSWPLGTVRMLTLMKERQLQEGDLKELVADQARDLDDLFRCGGFRPDIFLGTGGNLTCLGDLRKNMLDKKNSTYIYKAELERIYKKLVRLGYHDRVKKLKLRKDRADVLMPALAVTQWLMDQGKFTRLELPAVGLREGLIRMMSARKPMDPHSIDPA